MDGPKISRLYYTTRDVCDLFAIPPHQLRGWEKHFSFLKPIRRKSGRRLFRPQDLELVRRVKQLKDEGYTDEGIAEILLPGESVVELSRTEPGTRNEPELILIREIKRELKSMLRILTE